MVVKPGPLSHFNMGPQSSQLQPKKYKNQDRELSLINAGTSLTFHRRNSLQTQLLGSRFDLSGWMLIPLNYLLIQLNRIVRLVGFYFFVGLLFKFLDFAVL
jgi:hypothetical protein